MTTRRPRSRGYPAPLDGDALTNGPRWLAVAGGETTGGNGVDMTAIETAIRAVAATRAARKVFEARYGLREQRLYVLEGPVYAEHHRLVMADHEARSVLWRTVNQAIEEVTE